MVRDGTYEAHANRKLNETIHFSESFTVVEPRNYMRRKRTTARRIQWRQSWI